MKNLSRNTAAVLVVTLFTGLAVFSAIQLGGRLFGTPSANAQTVSAQAAQTQTSSGDGYGESTDQYGYGEARTATATPTARAPAATTRAPAARGTATRTVRAARARTPARRIRARRPAAPPPRATPRSDGIAPKPASTTENAGARARQQRPSPQGRGCRARAVRSHRTWYTARTLVLWSDRISMERQTRRTGAMPAKREIDWAALTTGSTVSESVAAHIQRWIQDGSLEPGIRLPPSGSWPAFWESPVRLCDRPCTNSRSKGSSPASRAWAPWCSLLEHRSATWSARSTGRAARAGDRRLRLVFEPQIVERAAFAAPRPTSPSWRSCVPWSMRRCPHATPRRTTRASRRFARATHNALLVALAETTANWLREARMATHARSAAREASWREHLDLLAAVRRRDGGLARRLMREHVDSATRQMIAAAAGA